MVDVKLSIRRVCVCVCVCVCVYVRVRACVSARVFASGICRIRTGSKHKERDVCSNPFVSASSQRTSDVCAVYTHRVVSRTATNTPHDLGTPHIQIYTSSQTFQKYRIVDFFYNRIGAL